MVSSNRHHKGLRRVLRKRDHIHLQLFSLALCLVAGRSRYGPRHSQPSHHRSNTHHLLWVHPRAHSRNYEHRDSLPQPQVRQVPGADRVRYLNYENHQTYRRVLALGNWLPGPKSEWHGCPARSIGADVDDITLTQADGHLAPVHDFIQGDPCLQSLRWDHLVPPYQHWGEPVHALRLHHKARSEANLALRNRLRFMRSPCQGPLKERKVCQRLRSRRPLRRGCPPL